MADFNSNDIKLIYNNKYEILTPDGFKDFDGVILGYNSLLYIELENGLHLKCTPLHKILINESREYVDAISLCVGDNVYTIHGIIPISYINELPTDQVYELFNVHDNHSYAVNDIYSLQCLYLDEFAFIKPHIADEFIASVFPTISSGKSTKVIITSTPNGMNHFFRMWEDACEEDELATISPEDTNGYIKSEIPWNAEGLGRDAEWARNEMKKIGEIRFNQEYLCEFVGSVSTLIDHHFLKTLESKKPMKIPNLPDFIRIYAPPLKKEKLEAEGWEYVASLDSGYGVHQDSSVLQIFLVKSNITLEQVATISSNKMDIDLFCKKSYVILKKYYEPSLIIEQNGPGLAAMKFFYNSVEYENILHFDPSGRHMGLWASEKTKQNACILFKTYIERKFMKIYDRQTINEMHSFGKVTQERWGGLGGNHDDHITATYWIPYYIQSPYYYGKIVEVNMKELEEDEVILKTEEEIASERMTLEKMQNKSQVLKEMENNAKYLSNNTKKQRSKDDDDDDSATGMVMFQR